MKLSNEHLTRIVEIVEDSYPAAVESDEVDELRRLCEELRREEPIPETRTTA